MVLFQFYFICAESFTRSSLCSFVRSNWRYVCFFSLKKSSLNLDVFWRYFFAYSNVELYTFDAAAR